MKPKRFTEEQIIGILKQVQAGMKIVAFAECMASATKRRTRYCGMKVSNAKRLKELETENKRLKQMLADTMLENRAIKDVLSKSGNACCPAERGNSHERRVPARFKGGLP